MASHPASGPFACCRQVAIIEVKKAFGGPTGLTSKAVREAAKRIIKTVDQVGASISEHATHMHASTPTVVCL